MYDLYLISEILDQIKNTGSTISKEAMLRECEDVPGFKEILNFIYDPYFTTGLGVKKLEKPLVDDHGGYMSPEEFMDYLRQNTTGDDVDIAIANGFIYSYDTEESMWLAMGIATKSLQIGVSITTLNKVFGPGFIPKVGIMRGMNCPEYIEGWYIATEKIDGNRRLLFNKNTGPEIYTRSGKPDYGLVDILKQMRHLPRGYVYDAECVAIGDFEDSIALRQASASILNSGGTRRGVKAQIFDMLPIAEYNEGRSKYHALARKAQLAILFDDTVGLDMLRSPALSEATITHLEFQLWQKCDFNSFPLANIEALPILGMVTNKEQAIELATPIWEAGREGIMLVDFKSPYEVSPNPRKTLLKLKLLKEFECKCTGVVEGINKYEGMMGAITVDYIRDGVTYEVKVGSGFTDYDREYYWDNPDEIIGKIIEIESFGESKNAQGDYSINCPIFKRIKGDVD